ncbi:DUF1672 family protein [Bacillus sp. E(2018)]|uniref:DUF1672 family protein n=1 Tax=Bacillus sp. E(2018) TaxID=2502239 RepID=UPI0010F56DCB|nr:DUF1672 family protein [Bacillus sp. E(2018)]
MTKITKVITTLLIFMLMAGCMDGKDEKKESPYARVQDYTGQEYRLPNGDKNDKIAEESRGAVISATEEFFIKKFNMKVKVNNIVGNKTGASVYVQSVEGPLFHTFAVIPIDNQEKIRPEGIWTQEGEVEGAILSGIYALIHEEKIKHLDNYLDGFVKQYPVTGVREESYQNTSSTGFTTPYYYITIPGDSLNPYFDHYVDNPMTTKEEYQTKAQSLSADPKEFRIVIELYMKDKMEEPNQKIFDELVADIEEMDNLPPGYYTIILNDNLIDKENGYGKKDNSLMRRNPEYIIKK